MADEGEEEQLVAPQNVKFTKFEENMVENQEILYEDEKIKITSKGVLLYSYWFPFGLKKFIPFESIKHHEIRKNISHFHIKAWGIAADFEVWWHMDFKKRFGERNAIILDVGGWPKIGFCPAYGKLEDVEKAYDIIAEHCHEH